MKKKPPSIQDLYPELNEDELKEAEMNLDLYAEWVLRVITRIMNDPAVMKDWERLTEKDPIDRIR